MSNDYDIDAIQGKTLERRIYAKDCAGNYLNLSGYSASGQVRYNYSATGILFNLAPVIYTTNYSSGIIDISGSATGLAVLPVGQFVYDLEIYSPSNYVSEIIRGKFSISPEVTR